MKTMSEVVFAFVFVSLLALEVLFFLSSVIGNAVVVFVISRNAKFNSKSNYLVLSVAVADLLIGLFALPFGVVSVSRKLSSIMFHLIR